MCISTAAFNSYKELTALMKIVSFDQSICNLFQAKVKSDVKEFLSNTCLQWLYFYALTRTTASKFLSFGS